MKIFKNFNRAIKKFYSYPQLQPNLTNNTWLYGGSKGVLTQTIMKGRNGIMPPHGEFLGKDKVHLLTAYVYSLRQ